MPAKSVDLGYSVRRRFVDDFYVRRVPKLTAGARVLDLGGHRARRRGAFRIGEYDLRVVCMDLSPDKRPDVQADAARVPFPDERFDAVVCSELLEHVPDPRLVLAEVYRVLCAGGVLLMCVPFHYRIHGDPCDYGRYTDHYWRDVLSRLGFQEVLVEWQGLFYSVLVDFCKQYVDHVWHRPLRDAARYPLAWLQNWALRRERARWVRDHPFLSSFTTGYGVVAVKSSCRAEPQGQAV